MYEYEVQGWYSGTWECVHTTDSVREARATLREYRANEAGTYFRVKRVRVAEAARCFECGRVDVSLDESASLCRECERVVFDDRRGVARVPRNHSEATA